MSRLYLFLSIVVSQSLFSPLSYSQDPSIQAQFIHKPAEISTYGVPPLPLNVINDVKPYTESRVAYLQDWHPLRREMLILTDISTSMQSHIVKMPGGMRKQVTFYQEPTFQSLFDPKSGEYIVAVKDVAGNEFWQIYRQDLTTGKTVLLTNGGNSMNFNLLWNNKGDKLFYTSLKKNEVNRQVYVVNPADPGSNRLFINLEGPGWSIEAISSDDRKIILSGESRLWLYDTLSGMKTSLLPKSGKKGDYSCKGFNADGTGIYLLTNEGSEFNQLAYYDLKNEKLTILTHFNWDVYNAYPSPDRRKIAFIVNEAGASKAYIFNTVTREYKLIDGLPTGVIYGMRWSKDNELLGFHVSTSNANSDIYTWNSKTGKIMLWVQNELGGIDVSTIPVPKLIKWKSFDGLEISGFLYPANKKFMGKRPVIIDIHGGPVMQARPLYNGSGNYYTNEMGIVVIYPNIRGSLGYGKTFTELDNGLNKENAVKDIGALLDWVKAQPDLDPDRIMVTGGSYGGYMTYRSGIEFNSRIRCAVALFGPSNMLTDINTIDSVYKIYRRQEYGDERDSVYYNYFLKTAPVKNVERLTMPIFIVQGKNDQRVPYTESEQMAEAIKKNNGKVWYLIANDEGHGFSKKENADYLFYATIDFIKKYLLN